MYVPETFKCDVCDAEHTPSNGWYLIQSVPGVLMGIHPFDVNAAKSLAAVCGEKCLHVYISQKLGSLGDNKLP